MKSRKFVAVMMIAMAVILTACGKSESQGQRKPQEEEPKTLQQLLVPDTVDCDLDGEVADISWEAISGANGYTVIFQDEEYLAEECGFSITSIAQGMTYTFNIKANGDNINTTDSEWWEYSFTTPVYSYTEDITFDSAVFLSSSQLLEWVAENNYTYETSAEDGWYIVDVCEEDSDNSGFWNGVKRAGAAALEGYIDGYFGGIDETVDGYYSDPFSLVEQYARSGTVKDTFQDIGEEIKENAEDNAEMSAIEYALGAAFTDTNIHYIYYYREGEENRAAELETISMLKKHHEDFEEQMIENSTAEVDDLGRNITNNELFKKNYYFVIQETESSGLERWEGVIYTE